jgi:hypothetical protein
MSVFTAIEGFGHRRALTMSNRAAPICVRHDATSAPLRSHRAKSQFSPTPFASSLAAGEVIASLGTIVLGDGLAPFAFHGPPRVVAWGEFGGALADGARDAVIAGLVGATLGDGASDGRGDAALCCAFTTIGTSDPATTT